MPKGVTVPLKFLMDNLRKRFNLIWNFFFLFFFKSTRGGFLKFNFFWSFEMKKLHYHKKEYPFASKYHYHMYIFDNSYPNYDKTLNPSITFQGDIFRKVLGVELSNFN